MPDINVSPIKQKPIVQTDAGTIQGVRSKDGTYNMFMGIPYAKLGKNPFGLSIPYPKFKEVFDADDDTAVSPQMEEFKQKIVGSVDCLHLNIYVPDTNKYDIPVMVWIYGGKFEIGHASRFLYGPKYFMTQNVILITVNYRVGPYGFLCLNTPDVPGNQGLKDIRLALRWIKRNIQYFNGDENNVTVFGESSGATTIDLFLTLDEPLFDKTIIMSGTVSRPLVVREADVTVPKRIAARLGFETDDGEEAVEYLSNVDPHMVIKAYLDLKILFRPCIEKYFEGIEPLILTYPMNIPVRRSIPIMMGYCDSESMFRYQDKKAFDRNIFEFYLKSIFNFGNDLEDIGNKVKKMYLGDKNISIDVINELSAFDSDLNFVHPIQTRIKELISYGCTVYHYMFAYSGDRNFVKKRCKNKSKGAYHADDIAYLFDISYETKPTDRDQLVIDRLTTLYANFSKFGNPTPNISKLLPVKWLPANEDLSSFIIGDELSYARRPFYDRMVFWDIFHRFYRDKLQHRKSNMLKGGIESDFGTNRK